MADELDPILEARLRAALQGEADALPFTPRAAELKRSAANRRLARRSRWIALVAVAASVIVVLGGAAILSSVRPEGDVAATPASTTPADRPLTSYPELEAILAAHGPTDQVPTALRGEQPSVHGGELPWTATLGPIHGATVVADCIGGSITVGIKPAEPGITSLDHDCGDGPFVMGIGVVGDLFVTSLPSVRWRLVAGDQGATEASALPSPTPFELASYAELEAMGADNIAIGSGILGEAEQTAPVPGAGDTETTMAEFSAYDHLDFFVSCTDGALTVDVYEGENLQFSAGGPCRDTPHQISDAVPSGGPVRVLVRTTGPVTWRVVVFGLLRQQDVASAPPVGHLQPGETRLVRMDVHAGDPVMERTATIPAGTDVLYLTSPCAGEGTLEIEIDGVAASYACGTIGIEEFTPDLDNQLLVRASATGTAAFAVRVGAVDSEAARPGAWRPPALRLSGPDQTAGDIATLTAFPGCGWSWQPKGYGGFSESCGPSWQPMGAALWQHAGTWVTLHLGGGWTITEIAVEIARNEDILATGRAPESEQWEVRAVNDEPFVMDVPPPGDWGVRLWVSGERNGDRFQVPYYARIVVAGS